MNCLAVVVRAYSFLKIHGELLILKDSFRKKSVNHQGIVESETLVWTRLENEFQSLSGWPLLQHSNLHVLISRAEVRYKTNQIIL